jgi:hypothetical protein
MPLDVHMPDPASLVHAVDVSVSVSAPEEGVARERISVFDDGVVRVTAVPVTHGRAHPALAYRFDTPDGVIVFSGDTPSTRISSGWHERPTFWSTRSLTSTIWPDTASPVPLFHACGPCRPT